MSDEDDIVTTGPKRGPIRVGVHGNSGVGKTTFAAHSPDPIFLCAEQGTEEHDVHRLPEPKTWVRALELIDKVISGKLGKDRKTFVIDTGDWLEHLMIDYVCRRDNGQPHAVSKKALVLLVDDKPHVEGYGFGDHVKVLLAEWKLLVSKLNLLRKRGMNIVLLFHSHVEKVKNVDAADFGVVAPAISKLAAGYVEAWLDALLYVKLDTVTIEAGSSEKRAKVRPTGERSMYTDPIGSWSAKSRYGHPDKSPFSWWDFISVVDKNGPIIGKRMRDEFRVKLDELTKKGMSSEAEGNMRRWLCTVGNDIAALEKGFEKLKKYSEDKPKEVAPAATPATA